MTGRHRARRSDKCSRRRKIYLGGETRKNKGAVLPSYGDGLRRICAVRTRHGPLGTKPLRLPQGASDYPLACRSGSARKALPPRCRSAANGVHQSCAAARCGPANKRASRYGEQSREATMNQSQCTHREGHMVLRQGCGCPEGLLWGRCHGGLP